MNQMSASSLASLPGYQMPSESNYSDAYVVNTMNAGRDLTDHATVPKPAVGRPVLYLLMGLPGSGKTFFRCFVDELKFAFIISKDEMRGSNKETKQRALLEEYLSRGINVVIDNTNVSREVREDAIKRCKKYNGHVVGYFMDVPRADCESRNLARGLNAVPFFVMANFARELQKPKYSEGFDEIFMVRTAKPTKGFFKVTRVTRAKGKTNARRGTTQPSRKLSHAGRRDGSARRLPGNDKGASQVN